MSFQPWFAILICILVSLSGCMKAAEKIITVPVPETKETKATVEQQAPYDPDIPKEYHHLLQGAKADDWRIPHIFLALADRHMAEGQEGRANHFLDRAAKAFAVKSDSSGEALVFSKKVLYPDADRSRARGSRTAEGGG